MAVADYTQAGRRFDHSYCDFHIVHSKACHWISTGRLRLADTALDGDWMACPRPCSAGPTEAVCIPVRLGGSCTSRNLCRKADWKPLMERALPLHCEQDCARCVGKAVMIKDRGTLDALARHAREERTFWIDLRKIALGYTGTRSNAPMSCVCACSTKRLQQQHHS